MGTKSEFKLDYPMYTEQAYGRLSNLTHRELVKEVITRGYGFNDAITKSHGVIADFFLQHYLATPKPQLLDEYDRWIEQEIVKNPDYEPTLLHPSLRLGFIEGAEIEKQAQRIKPQPEKPIREKTEDGLVAGTKKAMTYKLTNDGINIEDIIDQVSEAFPDAKENSIRIWHRRALNEK